MLTPNILHHGLLRIRSAVLGNRIIRLVDGLNCPRRAHAIHNEPERTNDGWRILCPNCHIDIIE
jgi:hypothetical protein